MNNFFVILEKNYKNRYQRWLPNKKFFYKRFYYLKIIKHKTSKKLLKNKIKNNSYFL